MHLSHAMDLNNRQLYGSFYLFCLALLIINANQFALGAITYAVSIKPHEDSCSLLSFGNHNWKSPRRLVGNYELITDNDHNPLTADPLLVYIMRADETGKVIWSNVGETRSSFNVNIPAGSDAAHRYWFCIQNSNHGPESEGIEQEHPDSESRMVGFTYSLVDHDIDQESVRPLTWNEENVADWNHRSLDIQADLKTLVDHHQYLKIREIDHRTLVERTFTHVLEWTLAEAAVVIVVAIGQVLYFRRFLENKRCWYV